MTETESVPSVLQVINRYADEIQFRIEPYGMIYTMRRGEIFTVMIAGVFEQNQFEIDIEIDCISVYGTRDTMSIFNAEGVKLEF